MGTTAATATAAATLVPLPSAASTRHQQLLLQRPGNGDAVRWSPRLRAGRRSRRTARRSVVPVARLFGPAIFEASKLKVLFLGDGDRGRHAVRLPRTYTLTHSDVTAKLTLAISQTINDNQLGWYNKLQRDEVVAEWKKVKGMMSLHVHCHISGGHFLLDFIAQLRYYIFSKELPVVLKAFVHGDTDLFDACPELEESMVWVYFHSTLPEFNKVECWGPLREAASGNPHPRTVDGAVACPTVRPRQCSRDCSCCFPPYSTIPWAHEFEARYEDALLDQQRRRRQV